MGETSFRLYSFVFSRLSFVRVNYIVDGGIDYWDVALSVYCVYKNDVSVFISNESNYTFVLRF